MEKIIISKRLGIGMDNLTEKEKGYFFGLFEGDGYKYYAKKTRQYKIEFYLNSERDKDIIEFLVKLLEKIGFKPNLYQDKRYKCKRIRVYSKKLFEIMDKNIDHTNKSREFKIGFVSGIIDSEGHVNSKKSYIMIVNTNKDLLDKCKEFLKEININSSISKRLPSKKDKLDSYRMYVSVNFRNIPHLSTKTDRL